MTYKRLSADQLNKLFTSLGTRQHVADMLDVALRTVHTWLPHGSEPPLRQIPLCYEIVARQLAKHGLRDPLKLLDL
jgi:hypothetical protein